MVCSNGAVEWSTGVSVLFEPVSAENRMGKKLHQIVVRNASSECSESIASVEEAGCSIPSEEKIVWITAAWVCLPE